MAIEIQNNPNQQKYNHPNTYPMPNSKILKYDFGQIQEALVAYMGTLELRLNNIISENDGIPVFSHGLDAGYYMRKKYINNDSQELYNKIPRCVVKFEDIVDSPDQNGAQQVRIRYVFNNKTYEAMFRRKTMMQTVTNQFITTNYMRALEAVEIIQSLLHISYPYTYEFLGNTHQGAYELQNITIQQPSMEPSSVSKDFVVNFITDLQIHLWAIQYDTIREIKIFGNDGDGGPNEGDGFTGDGGKTEGKNKIKWVLKPDNESEHTFQTPHNPDCLGCEDCQI